MIRTINFKVKSKSILYKRYCYQCDREMHIQNNGDCYSRFSSLEIVSAHSHGYHHFIKNIVEKKMILFPLHLSKWLKNTVQLHVHELKSDILLIASVP